MRPWTIDADDIQIADDFDDTVLHRTPSIDEFLSQVRDDKFIVTATKGFGKTLLLKGKRVGFQKNKSTLCLPESSLLDKPVGDKIFSTEMIELYGNSTDNWRKVWLIAIAAATLKRLNLTDRLSVNHRLADLLADGNLRSVIDHFVNVLDFPRGDLFKSGSDTDNQLVPRLRNLSAPVAIFVDNIDEYFNKHIVAAPARASDAGELSPNVWYMSQMALVETAYQLRRVNHHIKVFAAVRKEAFSKFEDTTPMVQQYRGSIVDLQYADTSLHEIFVNNIRKEKERNLVRPQVFASDPLMAFLGFTQVTHAYTGQHEDVLPYICRHTLRRPRDLMTIGQKLADIRPADRNEHTLKVAVNRAATEIAREYLNEIAPYIGALQMAHVFGMIPGNVLEREDVERVFRAHNAALPTDDLVHGEQHIFCALYKAGLLGYVGTDHVTSLRVQKFLLPGERTFDPDGVLPASSHYLVHPILAELISQSNAAYLDNIDRANVVGNGRPWRDPDAEQPLCVLRADVRGFSKFVTQPELEHSVREALRAIVRAHAAVCRYAEVSDGDAITVVHDDPNALVKIGRRIMEDLHDVQGHPILRVALDYGPVTVSRSGNSMVASGAPLRTAARLEPHVTPNEIWSTAGFKRVLERSTSLFEAREIGAGELQGEAWADGRLDIRKPGSTEPSDRITAYRIVGKSMRG
jgi:class 3 adenylate cyclase